MKLKEYLGQFKSINPYATGFIKSEGNIPDNAKSVKNPSDVPKGWNVIKGPRGGTCILKHSMKETVKQHSMTVMAI